MKSGNVIQHKSYKFARRIILLHKFLIDKYREYDVSRQVLRSGTSIGANVEEAIGGTTKKDFKYKMSIAYREARETHYWIRLLRDTDYITHEMSGSMLNDCDELLKILGSIIKSTRFSLNNGIPNSPIPNS
ncbi:MAG: four helix bundle protein [bacterium]|nr:four helix bundle protein [bacterium]